MKAEIYTKPSCTYCIQAKQLLNLKNIPYIEHIVDGVAVKKEHIELKVPATALPLRTLPQIFVDDEYVGGYQQLALKLAAK